MDSSGGLAERRIDERERRRRQLIRATIAVIVLGILVGALWWVLTRELPDGNKEVVITLLGAITGSVITIVAFYFGDADGRESR